MADPVSESGSVGAGQMQPTDANSDVAVLNFAINQIVSQIDTMKMVKVVAVHPGPGTPPAAGAVDVQILVNLLDGSGNATPQGTVYSMPYIRLGGGPWDVIVDPAVGDIGIAIASDRDISNAVKGIQGGNSQQVNPGSFRKYDISDAVYIGRPLSKPVAYIWLKPDGTFVIADKPGNVLTSSSGGIAVTTAPGGDFVVNGISVTKHTHAVTDAPGETGVPVG